MCAPRETISGFIFSILMSQQQNRKHLQIIPPATATSLNYCNDSLNARDIPQKWNNMSNRVSEETMRMTTIKKATHLNKPILFTINFIKLHFHFQFLFWTHVLQFFTLWRKLSPWNNILLLYSSGLYGLQNYLGANGKCRCSGPTQNLVKQNLHFNQGPYVYRDVWAAVIYQRVRA